MLGEVGTDADGVDGADGIGSLAVKIFLRPLLMPISPENPMA